MPHACIIEKGPRHHMNVCGWSCTHHSSLSCLQDTNENTYMYSLECCDLCSSSESVEDSTLCGQSLYSSSEKKQSNAAPQSQHELSSSFLLVQFFAHACPSFFVKRTGVPWIKKIILVTCQTFYIRMVTFYTHRRVR